MHRVHRFTPVTRRLLFTTLVLLLALLFGLGGFADAADAGKGKAPTVVKELDEKRTQNSKTYLLSDGNLRSEIYAEPTGFKDEKGAWQDIDPTLVADTVKGGFQAKAMPFKVSFLPPGQADKVSPIAQVEYEGFLVSMSGPDGVKLGNPMAAGNKASYAGPAQSLSLDYEVLPDGTIKETIVLQNKNAPSTFTYTISHPGLVLSQDYLTGEWGLRKALDQDPLFTLGGLNVCDSSEGELWPAAVCAEAKMEVKPGKDYSTITITLDEAWLADKDRKYPVLVDPTLVTEWQWYEKSKDTWVWNWSANTSFGSATSMYTRRGDNMGTKRSLVSFSLPSGLYGSTVQSAILQLTKNSGVGPVELAAMTKAWSESSTWNSLGTYGLDYSRTLNAPSGYFIRQDVTDIVQRWVDGTAVNYGFCMYVAGLSTGAGYELKTNECHLGLGVCAASGDHLSTSRQRGRAMGPTVVIRPMTPRPSRMR